MRVFSMIACPDRGVYCGADVDRIQWDEYDGRFRVEGVKLVADGSSLPPSAPRPLAAGD